MSILVGWICIEGSPWFSERNQGWSVTLLSDCDRNSPRQDPLRQSAPTNGNGISSSLCGPLYEGLDCWKIPVNKPSGFARIRHLSLCCRCPRNAGQRQVPINESIRVCGLGLTVREGPNSRAKISQALWLV